MGIGRAMSLFCFYVIMPIIRQWYCFFFFFKRTQKSGTKTSLQSGNFQAGRASSSSSSVTSDNPSQVPRVYSVSYTYFLQHLPRSLLYPGRNMHFLKQRSPRFQKGETRQGQAHPASVETANPSFILWTLLCKP